MFILDSAPLTINRISPSNTRLTPVLREGKTENNNKNVLVVRRWRRRIKFHAQSVHNLVGDQVSTVDGFRVVGLHTTGTDFKDVDVVLGFVPRSQVLQTQWVRISRTPVNCRNLSTCFTFAPPPDIFSRLFSTVRRESTTRFVPLFDNSIYVTFSCANEENL